MMDHAVLGMPAASQPADARQCRQVFPHQGKMMAVVRVGGGLVPGAIAGIFAAAGLLAVALGVGDGSILRYALLLLCFQTAFGWYLYQYHLLPLHQTLEAAQKMADGNISEPVACNARGSWRDMQQALHDIGERVFSVVGRVRCGTAAIATTSGFINSDNAALSGRTESQASALQQSAASMEQLTAAVKQNAEAAQQANTLVAMAFDSAASGERAVQRVMETMAAISDSSRRIADIIGIIDTLAFQTNILALNAAVEAARAGEQGRSFAVVATEVRDLAQRSAGAAAEIKTLIAESVTRVKDGGRLVDVAGATMHGIMSDVRQVADIIQDIANASAEQSVGLDEVNRAVVHIDGMTQQNAALVEEATLTASGLHAQALSLAELVSPFLLGRREFGDAEDAVNMVREAVAFVRRAGPAALLADVKKLNVSLFIDRDLYLSIYDTQAMCVANGSNPRLVGANGRIFKDADGKVFVAEIVDKAMRSSRGWVDYKHPHPLTRKIQQKSAYFELAEGLVISCGFYKTDR